MSVNIEVDELNCSEAVFPNLTRFTHNERSSKVEL